MKYLKYANHSGALYISDVEHNNYTLGFGDGSHNYDVNILAMTSGTDPDNGWDAQPGLALRHVDNNNYLRVWYHCSGDPGVIGMDGIIGGEIAFHDEFTANTRLFPDQQLTRASVVLDEDDISVFYDGQKQGQFNLNGSGANLKSDAKFGFTMANSPQEPEDHFFLLQRATIGNPHFPIAVKGHISVTETMSLFVHGLSPDADNIPLFIDGHFTDADSITLFTEGYAIDSGNIDLFVEGHTVDTSNIALFIEGHSPLTNNSTLFIEGHDVSSGIMTLFVEGLASGNTENANIPLYIANIVDASGLIPLVTEGHSPLTDDTSLFIEGYTVLTDNIPLFIDGHSPLNNNIPMFIEGHTVLSPDNITLFIEGHTPDTDNITLFTEGYTTDNDNITLFASGAAAPVPGSGNLDNSMTLFMSQSTLTTFDTHIESHTFSSGIVDDWSATEDPNSPWKFFPPAIYTQANNMTLYIDGKETLSESTTLYTENRVETSGELDLYSYGSISGWMFDYIDSNLNPQTGLPATVTSWDDAGWADSNADLDTLNATPEVRETVFGSPLGLSYYLHCDAEVLYTDIGADNAHNLGTSTEGTLLLWIKNNGASTDDVYFSMGNSWDSAGHIKVVRKSGDDIRLTITDGTNSLAIESVTNIPDDGEFHKIAFRQDGLDTTDAAIFIDGVKESSPQFLVSGPTATSGFWINDVINTVGSGQYFDMMGLAGSIAGGTVSDQTLADFARVAYQPNALTDAECVYLTEDRWLSQTPTLFVQGHLPDNDNITLFAHGYTEDADSMTLYTVSSADASGEMTLFTHGQDADTDNITLFASGTVTAPASGLSDVPWMFRYIESDWSTTGANITTWNDSGRDAAKDMSSSEGSPDPQESTTSPPGTATAWADFAPNAIFDYVLSGDDKSVLDLNTQGTFFIAAKIDDFASTYALWSITARSNDNSHISLESLNDAGHGGNTVRLIVQTDSGDTAASYAEGSLSTGTWYIFGVRQDGTNIHLWVDGTKQTSDIVTGGTGAESDWIPDFANAEWYFQVGGRLEHQGPSTSFAQFDGGAVEVVYLDGSLTDDDMAQISSDLSDLYQ